MVESKPVLWDKTLEVLKDRNTTHNAWSKVCLALKLDFDVIDRKEKISLVSKLLNFTINPNPNFSQQGISTQVQPLPIKPNPIFPARSPNVARPPPPSYSAPRGRKEFNQDILETPTIITISPASDVFDFGDTHHVSDL